MALSSAVGEAFKLGIVSGIPWLILGVRGMGDMFQAWSYGSQSATVAVLITVLVMVVRQFWTMLLTTESYRGTCAERRAGAEAGGGRADPHP